MGLIILLRRDLTINRFRDVIIGALSSGVGTHAIMCSGFFQEDKKYQASSEANFTSAAKSLVEFKTIGVYDYSWMNSYRNFIKSMVIAGVNIKAYSKIGQRWHAKIFILKKDNVPLFAVIGSSNITRPAFSCIPPFNWESDVVMWTNNRKYSKRLKNVVAETYKNNPNEYIVAAYKPKDNHGITIDGRIKQIDNELNDINIKEIII
jgi:hypothetical protein